MAKDPTFPFYAQDYLVDTLRWSRAMQGLHVSLMAESWINGGLENDDGKPVGLGSTDVDLWLRIKHKWRLVDNLWISNKLEDVRKKKQAYSDLQSRKGVLSAQRKKERSTVVQPKVNQTSTESQPCVSEDENEIIKKIKESLDEIYLDQEKIKWPHIDFAFELETFKNKVLGSPSDYLQHTTNGIRKAFQYQLRNAKRNPTYTRDTSGITAEGTLHRLNSYSD